MNIHALFVGIDKYSSAEIPDLCCAENDANAFWAITKDTFPNGNIIKLTNHEATLARVNQEVNNISKLSTDQDLVIFYFSGHGSSSFRLVTHDSNPENFENTSISSDQICHWIGNFENKRLLVILDCCFAGGAGAKVVQLGVLAREKESSNNDLLKLIEGNGAMLIAAASSKQYAWEDIKEKHGILTEAVISILSNEDSNINTNQITLAQLAHFVSKKVEARAKAINKVQTPYIALQSEGNFQFPIFNKGISWLNLYPKQAKEIISENLDDLCSFNLPQEIIDIWKTDIPSLNEIQQDAINKAKILNGKSAVIIAPTSSGKTFIGEMTAIKNSLIDQTKCAYLVPMKALVHDKYSEFFNRYNRYGLRIVRSCGDISDNNSEITNNKFDLAIFTNEKFLFWALARPDIIEKFGLIIVDELQLISDPTRGLALEFLLTLLRKTQKDDGNPQIICLSAVIGKLNGFDEWLSSTEIRSNKRPVELLEGTVDYSGNFHFINSEQKEETVNQVNNIHHIKDSSQDIIIPLVQKLIQENERIIIFRNQKAITRACARYIGNSLNISPAQKVIDQIPRGDPSLSTTQLIECLNKGVAFHNADLTRIEREAIQNDFKADDGDIRVIVATPTLAMGVNTPANTILIVELEHPGQRPSPYTVSEYKNMIGRAGRLGYVKNGKAMIITTKSADNFKAWNNYIKAEPLDLESTFNSKKIPEFIVKVLATANNFTLDKVESFVKNSLAIYRLERAQKESVQEIQSRVNLEIQNLIGAKLIVQENELLTLTELGKASGKEGLEIESTIRISNYIQRKSNKSMPHAEIIAAMCLSNEIKSIFLRVHARSTKEKQRWDQESSQYISDPFHWNSTVNQLANHDDYIRIGIQKKFCLIMKWLQGLPIVEIENDIQQHNPDRFSSGPIQQIASRCNDILNSVGTIINYLVPQDKNFNDILNNLRIRLEFGVDDSLLPLIKSTSGVLDRASYLTLKNSNFLSLKDMVSHQQKIESILGKDAYFEIKHLLPESETVTSIEEQ